jgi:hypothetical protein
MSATAPAAEAVAGRIVRKGGDTVSALQAGIEGVPVNVESILFMGPTEDFPGRRGQHFRVADHVGLMPLLKFAHEASSGATEDSMEGMAAMYAMIRDCIHPGRECTCAKPGGKHQPGCEYDPGDWERFERYAIEQRAEGEDLMAVVEQAMEVVSARPIRQPSGSSPPGRPTSRKSRSRSSRPGSRVPDEARHLQPVNDLLSIT